MFCLHWKDSQWLLSDLSLKYGGTFESGTRTPNWSCFRSLNNSCLIYTFLIFELVIMCIKSILVIFFRKTTTTECHFEQFKLFWSWFHMFIQFRNFWLCLPWSILSPLLLIQDIRIFRLTHYKHLTENGLQLTAAPSPLQLPRFSRPICRNQCTIDSQTVFLWDVIWAIKIL